MNKCKCGCGQPIIQKSKYYTSEYIRGHNTRGKHLVHSGSFKKGHKINLGRKMPDNVREAIIEVNTGKPTWNKGLHTKSPMEGKKHTKEAREKISISRTGKEAWNKDKKCPQLSGENNPSWKGGITPKNKLERKLFRDTIRKQVLERDDYTCQICGQRGVKLQVDHIQSWADYEDGRFDINNCRTLCMSCHYFITFGKPMASSVNTWGHRFGERGIDL